MKNKSNHDIAEQFTLELLEAKLSLRSSITMESNRIVALQDRVYRLKYETEKQIKAIRKMFICYAVVSLVAIIALIIW